MNEYTARQIRIAEQQRVTIAIDDPEFASMVARVDHCPERVDVAFIPIDVVVYCLWLARQGKTQ